MVTSRRSIWQVIAVMALTFVLGVGTAFATSSHEGHQGSSSVDRPLWLDKLENQINYEEMMEGKQGDQDRLNKTYKSLMDRLKREVDGACDAGFFWRSISQLLGRPPTPAGLSARAYRSR